MSPVGSPAGAVVGVLLLLAAQVVACDTPAEKSITDPLRSQPRRWDLSPHTKRYSQFNEELIVRHFFDDRRGGVFVDVGCYHWRKHSTTYYLESELEWSGVGVDALGLYFAPTHPPE